MTRADAFSKAIEKAPSAIEVKSACVGLASSFLLSRLHRYSSGTDTSRSFFFFSLPCFIDVNTSTSSNSSTWSASTRVSPLPNTAVVFGSSYTTKRCSVISVCMRFVNSLLLDSASVRCKGQ